MKTLITKHKNLIATGFASAWTGFWLLQLNTGLVLAADSNTQSIDTFITFVCDWLKKIGGVVFASAWTGFWLLQLNTGLVLAADSNTQSIDTFITFVCDWLKKIGGVVASPSTPSSRSSATG